MAALLVPFVAGCFRELHRAPSVPDAGPDASAVDEADAQPPRGVRWLENGPTGDVEEGPATFLLTCVDLEGAPADCTFRCNFDDGGERDCVEVHKEDWVAAGTLHEPQPHRLCVKATPKARGLDGSEVCREFRATASTRPYVWVDEALPRDGSLLQIGLRCRQRFPDGTFGPVRSDCTMRCSLDGQPFFFPNARETYGCQWSQVARGEHVLRVEVQGPAHEPTRHVSALRFTIDRPEPSQETVVLPPLMSREQLDALGLGELLAPYGEFARACRGWGEAATYAEELRAYFSYAWGRLEAAAGPIPVALNRQQLADCRSVLEARPAACRSLPGIPRTFMGEGPLSVRLPDGCLSLLEMGVQADTCLTSMECFDNVCELPAPWTNAAPPLGTCGIDGPEEHADILCRARGCYEGMYCRDGTCALVSASGAPCDPRFLGEDCPRGHTCSSGGAPRCVEATLRAGERCAYDRDCVEGLCSRRHVCE